MFKSQTNVVFDALDSLLDEERSVLLKGDLESVSELVARKQALFDQLPGIEDKGGKTLGNLRAKALRNQALLDSALQGIRSVSDRMEALRRVRVSLETYDSKGRRLSVAITEFKRIGRRA
ncbi:flagellar biosynthesis protein FlgN [Shimia sp.]|uniref:flagellar biosynthesis protein FlgN n=1 Tax=Shimia sp. TaxID=1954381 RepID=UPI00329A351A